LVDMLRLAKAYSGERLEAARQRALLQRRGTRNTSTGFTLSQSTPADQDQISTASETHSGYWRNGASCSRIAMRSSPAGPSRITWAEQYNAENE
jgi:hypothetical protein